MTQNEVETKAAIKCEELWTSIQAEDQFQTVDSVVVQYEKNALSDILNRAYDVGKNSWSNITVTELE